MFTQAVLSETGLHTDICFGHCAHDACNHRHRVAVSFCRLCSRTIGYNLRYHQDAPHPVGYVHSACLAVAIMPEQFQAA